MTSNQYIPKFPLPDGIDSADQYLRMLTIQGMKHCYHNDGESKIRERIEHELSVIAQLGCADYFLIIWDALQHARQEGILIGPGRGSAAGSIVNYCLGITQVDPLKHGLLFERFLNTNKSHYPLPDIDVDGDERLYEEMLCYLPERYGKNHVAIIENYPCGIIISPIDVAKYFSTTTYTNCEGVELPMIQAKISDVEDAGFLKFDFFTLDYITVIRDTLNLVKSRCGINIDPLKIPLDDAETLLLFHSGHTEAIFQFGSKGMRHYLQKMPSVTFNDLVAINALYRPGTREWIPDFIACKRGEKRIEQPIIEMGTLLSETYGLTVYQEQLMYVAQLIAGLTPNESDHFRKGMCKKKTTRLKLKLKFIEGGMKNGHEAIESLWQNWKSKSIYPFLKSHAVCHTLIAFQTAYLKAHFPTEYMTALRLNNIKD